MFEGYDMQLFTVAKKEEQFGEVAEIVGKAVGKVTPIRAIIMRTYIQGEK
ncbi:MAG: hypothetical protein IPK55_13595 [Streptococcus sp.]|nr:hypothetical protein [Streptococcus sp.]